MTTDKEIIDEAIHMLEGTLIYMAHIRRYYPKVHNKTVMTKKFLKHKEGTDGQYKRNTDTMSGE